MVVKTMIPSPPFLDAKRRGLAEFQKYAGKYLWRTFATEVMG